LKKNTRKQLLDKLKQLAGEPAKKDQQEESILQQLFSSKEWQQANVIATTYPMAHEFDTTKLMKQAFKENKKIVIPKTAPKGQMDFFEYTMQTPLELTSFGVYEPITENMVLKEEIDLMIVPGVGFTKQGKRIGYGGGFYDRYLTGFRGRTISLAFEEQLMEDLEIEPHDKLVDKIIY